MTTENETVSLDDEPSVIGGAGSAAPMPTQADFRVAHKSEYVRLFVDVGVPKETAESWHDEQWDDLKDMTPQECFDSETSYWDNDGDE